MKKTNEKGYFFITATYGMFNYHNFEKNFSLMKDNHKHILMAHSQINLNNDFMKDISLKNKLNNISPCNFYYLKDFVLQHKRVMHFPFDIPDYLEQLPEYVRQTDLLTKLKIKNF
jgi:hypothetical protein